MEGTKAIDFYILIVCCITIFLCVESCNGPTEVQDLEKEKLQLEIQILEKSLEQ